MIKKREREIKYYGKNSCLALWKSQAEQIIRVYLLENLVSSYSKLLKWCAKERLVYRIVAEEELSKLTKSTHHEGICIVAKAADPLTFSEMLNELNKSKEATCLLYLDRVENPHNVGSLMRSAAHFAVPYILGETASLPGISGSLARVAEGGAEFVKLVTVDRPTKALLKLKEQGFVICSTSSHKGENLYQSKIPKRLVLVLGAESTGVSQSIAKLSEVNYCIPGTDAVESLNVSVAGSLILGEYWRQHMNSPK